MPHRPFSHFFSHFLLYFALFLKFSVILLSFFHFTNLFSGLTKGFFKKKHNIVASSNYEFSGCVKIKGILKDIENGNPFLNCPILINLIFALQVTFKIKNDNFFKAEISKINQDISWNRFLLNSSVTSGDEKFYVNGRTEKNVCC